MPCSFKTATTNTLALGRSSFRTGRGRNAGESSIRSVCETKTSYLANRAANARATNAAVAGWVLVQVLLVVLFGIEKL